MPDELTPAEASIGQCIWAVVGAAMDDDGDAIEYLLTGLTETDLGALVVTLAGMIGSTLAIAYGQEEGRRAASIKAVEYAAARP